MTDEARGLDHVAAIFEKAVPLLGAARAAYLREACGDDDALRADVDSMLAARDEQGEFLAEPTQAAAGSMSDAMTVVGSPREQVGQRIGNYKLLQQIGEGGFGEVYMAEQEKPVRRRVALKIIKLGMDTKQVIARFEAERQALAMMDHPNIARVLDAGATETGRPYFVMELVKGESITDYCDRHNVNVEDRLDLFQQTCNAVQHAHQKGIIHRDIKPSNVMVTMHDGQPVPKVIDFGIAKATDHKLTEKTIFTEFRQFIGTPEYMSPEQAEMSGIDIDTRSDIYSLGVLLYELLTGVTPFDSSKLRSAAYNEIHRIIREETPPRPSTRLSTLDTLPSVAAHRHTEPRKLGLLIRGDLDWIVMRALEKDRTRRYETASGFADDLQRYRDNVPVNASPPSTRYKLQKFIRRNKAGVTAATLIVAVLVMGVIGTTWGLVWAIDERDRADQSAIDARNAAESEKLAKRDALDAAQAARKAEAETRQRAEELAQVASFQSKQLSGIDAAIMGQRLRQGLRERVRQFAERAGADPTTIDERVAALDQLVAGADFTGMALQSLEENVFNRALDAIDAQFADQSLVRARLLQTTATTARILGLNELAEAPQRTALELREAELGTEDPATLESRTQAGYLAFAQGRSEEAERLFDEVLEIQKRTLGDDASDTLNTRLQLGWVMRERGSIDRAERIGLDVLNDARRLLGEEHDIALSAMRFLGVVYRRQENRHDDAEKMLVDALEIYRRVIGDEAHATLMTMNSLALHYHDSGRYDQSEPLFREGLEIRRRAYGDEHFMTLLALSNLAYMYRTRGEYEAAEPILVEVLETRQRLLGADHPDTLDSMRNLGILFYNQDRFDEAEAIFVDLLPRRTRVHGREHPETLDTLTQLAAIHSFQGRDAEAAALGRSNVDTIRRVLGPDHSMTLRATRDQAEYCYELGLYEESRRLHRAVLDTRMRLVGPNHRRTIEAARGLADFEVRRERYTVAESVLLDALESSDLPGDHAEILRTRAQLARVYLKQGKHEQAGAVLTEDLDAQVRVLASDPHIVARTHFDLARIAAVRGRRIRALEHLRSAVERGWAYRRLASDPEFDPMRNDPEFEAIAEIVERRLREE